jgi:hypothetical protein
MKAMVKEQVQGVIDNLNKQFFALPIFNVSKLFSLKYYPTDNDDLMTKEVDDKLKVRRS